MTKLTQEENDIIEYIEGGTAKSVSNVSDEINRYKSIATTQMNKKKAISIRLLESDLERLKSKAYEQGIPYQTLLSSLAHQYVSGKIKLQA